MTTMREGLGTPMGPGCTRLMGQCSIHKGCLELLFNEYCLCEGCAFWSSFSKRANMINVLNELVCPEFQNFRKYIPEVKGT